MPPPPPPPPPHAQMAHGRHVKYLQMGRAWDLAMHPLIFPLAHYFARRACDRAAFTSPLLLEAAGAGGGKGKEDGHGRTGTTNGRQRHHLAAAPAPAAATPTPSSGATIHLDGLLGLEGFALTEDGAAAALAPASDPARPRLPMLKATARVRVAGRLCNNFGTLHGGAVSILAERMAARVWATARRMAGWESEGVGGDDEAQGEGMWPHARTLSIDYMSPAPKGCEVTLEAWAAPLGPSPSPSLWPAPVSSAPVPAKAYPPLSGQSVRPITDAVGRPVCVCVCVLS